MVETHPLRECPDCGNDRVCSVREVGEVYQNLDDHADRAVERAANHPSTNLVCTFCWSVVTDPETGGAVDERKIERNPEDVTST